MYEDLKGDVLQSHIHMGQRGVNGGIAVQQSIPVERSAVQAGHLEHHQDGVPVAEPASLAGNGETIAGQTEPSPGCGLPPPAAAGSAARDARAAGRLY